MMKYFFIAIVALAFAAGVIPQTGSAARLDSNNVVGGSLKILNDTDGDVQIHTGSGFVEINKGSSTSVSCEIGRVISLADRGKKKEELFTVDDSMCGKTVRLSKYL